MFEMGKEGFHKLSACRTMLLPFGNEEMGVVI